MVRGRRGIVPVAILAVLLTGDRARAERDGLAAAPPVTLPTFELDEPIVPLGEEHEDDASLAEHAEEVSAITIKARLDEQKHAVVATETLRWKNVSRVPVRTLPVHAYLNAFKNESSVFLRSHLGAGRADRKPTEYGHLDITALAMDGRDLLPALSKTSPDDPDDETDLSLELPEAVQPGATVTLEIAFTAQLPSIVARTGHLGSFHMVAQWFPKIARLAKNGTFERFPFHRLSEFSADFGRYDVTMDVPATFEVGATGKRTEDARVGGRRVVRHVASDVHDFAWTAWDGFETHETTVDGVAVRFLSPKGHDEVRRRQLAGLRVGLRCYGARYGKYPYDVLTIVHPPKDADEAGGMEYPTLITTGGSWLGPPGVRFPEGLVVHEFGHQHFFGLVATNEHAFPFLDEGLNSYAETVCMEDAWGKGALAEGLGFGVSGATAHREGALRVGHDDVVARDAGTFATGRHYGRLVYSRTAALLLSLRGAYGPEVVDRALARYMRAYRWKHPDPRHLLAAFGDVGGDAVQENLRRGLYERGWVDYAVSDLSSLPRTEAKGVFDRNGRREVKTGSVSLGGYDSEVLLVRRGTLALPVKVELGFADGSRTRFVWSAEDAWAKHRVESKSELVWAVVDPDHEIVLDERFDNNAVSARPRSFAPSVWERVTYLGALAALLAP